MSILLSVGDGVTSDYVDLDSATIVAMAMSAPPPGEGERRREVALTIAISGASADVAWTNYQNIERKLEQARTARGAYGIGLGVTLGITLSTSNMVYLDVLDGSLTVVEFAPGGMSMVAELVLVCLPFARGAAVTVAASGTLTNGAGAVLSTLNIPGDVPALLRVTASDVSTGTAVMQRLRFVTRAMPDMTPGTDVSLIVDLAPAGAGVATTEADTIGGAYNTLSPSSDWQTVGTADKPAAQYSVGLMDLYARVRDGFNGLTMPSALTATATATGISRRQISPTVVPTAAQATVTLPSTALPGTLLTIQLAIKSTSAAPATPAGWTAGPAQTTGTSPSGSCIFYKIAAGGEQSVTVTWTGTYAAYAVMTEWYGLALSSPVDVQASASTLLSTSHPSGTTATTAQANALSLTMHAIGTTSTISRASGWAPAGDSIGGFLASYRVESAAGTKSHTATTATAEYSSAVIIVFKGRETAAENLAAGTYQYRVVPLDGSSNIGSASDVVSVAIASNDAAVLTWTPGGGVVASYRIYWDRGSGWQYHAYSSANPYYVHYTETSAVAGDPPSATSVPGQWRALVSLPSGTTRFAGAGVESIIGNLAWHLVYLGTFPLPPLPALDGETPQGWQVTLQGKRVDGAVNALDADALYLFPHDEAQLVASYAGLDLASKRDFVVETRRDGRTFGLLRATGTSTDAGQLDVAGQALIGPGDAATMVHVDRQGGVSDVVDSKFTLALRYIPRYRMLRG